MTTELKLIHELKTNKIGYYQPKVSLYSRIKEGKAEYMVETMVKIHWFSSLQDANKAFIKEANKIFKKL